MDGLPPTLTLPREGGGDTTAGVLDVGSPEFSTVTKPSSNLHTQFV